MTLFFPPKHDPKNHPKSHLAMEIWTHLKIYIYIYIFPMNYTKKWVIFQLGAMLVFDFSHHERLICHEAEPQGGGTQKPCCK